MKYGTIDTEEFKANGYTSEELRQLIKDWRQNAEAIGSDIYDLTGDLAIGPKIMEDLLNHNEELQKQMQEDREQAGITINYEMQVLQAAAIGHGVMASLLHSKSVLGEDSEQYKQIEKVCQARITQCFRTLVGLGLTHSDANQRLLEGY